MSMRLPLSTHLPAVLKLHFEQAPTFFMPKPENACMETLDLAKRSGRGVNDCESCPPSGRTALRERLEQLEREIEMYRQFDKLEKARFNRESFLWTAEDRIDWQETQLGNAERLRELLEERRDIARKLRT